jgi:hypothetical protein
MIHGQQNTKFIFLIGVAIFCSEHLHVLATPSQTRLSLCSNIPTKLRISKYKHHFHFK